MLVRSTRNRPALELAGIESLGVGEGMTPPTAGGVMRIPDSITLLEAADTPDPITFDAGWEMRHDVPSAAFDCTGHRVARLVAHVDAAGPVGAAFILMYRPLGSGRTWLRAGAVEMVEVALDRTGVVIGTDVPLHDACTGDCEFRLVSKGGDGATPVVVRWLAVQFFGVSVGVPEGPEEGCLLPDEGWKYHEDYTNLATLDDLWTWTDQRPQGMYAGGAWDEPYNAHLDKVVTYAGHPTVLGRRDGAYAPAWPLYWVSSPVAGGAHDVTRRMRARIIIKMYPGIVTDPTTAFGAGNRDPFNILDFRYRITGGGQAWSVRLGVHWIAALGEDRMILTMGAQLSTQIVDLGPATDFTDGQWRDYDLTVDVHNGVVQGHLRYGLACMPDESRTLISTRVPQTFPNMATVDSVTFTRWGGPTGGGPSEASPGPGVWRIAEWALDWGNHIDLPPLPGSYIYGLALTLGMRQPTVSKT